MHVLVVSQVEVRELLPMAACVDLMEETLAALAEGRGLQPLRTVMWLPERPEQVGALGLMPSYADHVDTVGVKVVTVFPDNHGTELDAHQGAVLLFESKHGRPLAFVDASEITAIRTAAVSGVATRTLARAGADTLAILGTGIQARTHLEAIAHVRPLRQVRVWGRTVEKARRFAEEQGRVTGLPVTAVASAREAVAGADIVCTTTAASAPILEGAWLEPGTHVNAVGACIPRARELDAAAMVRGRLFVDRRESALAESGDLILAMKEKAIAEDAVRAELGEVLTGSAEGRVSDDDVTIFLSLGLGIEDVAAARHVYDAAMATGRGQPVLLGEPHP